MKDILFTKLHLLVVVFGLASLFSSCIKEDLDACAKLTLMVVNHNDEDVTALGLTSEAKLFVFDANSKLLETRDLDLDFITGRKTIELPYPDNTKLHIVAWGNLKGKQNVTEPTKAEDLLVSLKSNNELAQSPDSLFFGDIDVEVMGNGVAGGDKQIVIRPKTGTVEMRTIGLQYVYQKQGLRATSTECNFYMNRTLSTYNSKGELTGDSVYYNPEGDWKTTEWITPTPQTLYEGQKMTGSIEAGNKRYDVSKGEFEDGTVGPIEIYPFQKTLVVFEWDETGAFLGAKIRVTPWGVVDDDIEF